MKKTTMFLILLLLCISLIGTIGCGGSLKVMENEFISFTLDNNFDCAFLDVNPDISPSDSPLGDQRRVAIWDKEFPNNWSIFIYYPCPDNVSDLMGNTNKRTVNGVEVLYTEDGLLYLQAYLDPTMTVGISSLKDEMSIKEADMIIESLKAKKGIDELKYH